MKANVGVAVIPAAVEMSGLRRIRLKELNLTRVVSAYVVAGRRRSVACATLLNMLRSADWSSIAEPNHERSAG